MIFGKYINRYYLKNAPVLLLGLLALLMVDYIQLLIPQFYRLVINGVNLGQVVVNGQTLPFTKEVFAAAYLPAHDLDRGAHGHWALFVAYLLFRLRCAGCCQPARADV